jgi:hypothetical protein
MANISLAANSPSSDIHSIINFNPHHRQHADTE